MQRLPSGSFLLYTSFMKNFTLKLLLNRVQYDTRQDIAWITDYLHKRGMQLNVSIVHSDITGYTVKSIENVFGNYQNILAGAEPLVKPYLSPADDICVLVIQGYKEFDKAIPSESLQHVYIPGTKTLFASANADDPFYDEVPNFRVWLLHEILHAIAQIAIHEGYPIVDPLDVMILPNHQTVFYHLVYDPENVNSAAVNLIEQFYFHGFLKYV